MLMDSVVDIMKRLKYVGLGGSGEREGSGWRGGERDFTIILYFEHIRENE